MFERTLKIIEKPLFDKIQEQKILLVGLGGVGGYAFEALIRIGFQNITIIDADTFEKTNLNRQILCTTNNIGTAKVEEAKKRGLEMNPNAKIITHQIFLNEENTETIFTTKYDYIIDACDTITTKCLLIKKALEQSSEIITCLGTGNRINPGEVTITKLKNTYNDPLAKAMRNLLKKQNITLNIPVVWSKELPIKTKSREPGSIVLVPAAAGLQLVYYILEHLKRN